MRDTIWGVHKHKLTTDGDFIFDINKDKIEKLFREQYAVDFIWSASKHDRDVKPLFFFCILFLLHFAQTTAQLFPAHTQKS